MLSFILVSDASINDGTDLLQQDYSVNFIGFIAKVRAMKKLDEVKLNLKRIKQMGETTLGKLTIEGVSKSWFVLEPAGPDSIIGCLMPGKTWGSVAKSHYYVGNSKSALKEIFTEIASYKKTSINISNQLEQ
ncbi:conserved hypothetical protein [Vibrio owensii]|uniref:hypothetical protein n=1 Tax=Vibrio owensii TaxID=696485 RepID=UPI00289559C7|nr:conserved hypothetical protein [Vibrio owensii]